MGRTIKVLVVDDSAFMRKALTLMLESDPDIRVVATARDGKDGIEKIRQYQPDIVTLDIEMPVMNGLEALAIIMKEMPMPVLMISSTTSEGAVATMDALNLGAVDFITKDTSYVSVTITEIKAELVSKVKHIVRSKALQFRLQRAGRIVVPGNGEQKRGDQRKGPLARARGDLRGVVIGVSTGGPFALQNVIPRLPANFPLGIAIVQHMPPKFTKSLAERLNSMSQIEVHEAQDGEPLKPGLAVIAPGGRHLTFKREGSTVITQTPEEPSNVLYRPSADIMMTSALEAFGGPLVGLIMTGMGKDGLEGLRAIKSRTGVVFAQSENTCVVYGMPKAAVQEGLADAVLPLDEIAAALVSVCGM